MKKTFKSYFFFFFSWAFFFGTGLVEYAKVG